MKKIKFSKSLDLNKSVITKLSDNQSNAIIGGASSGCTNTNQTCPSRATCITQIKSCPTADCTPRF